MNEEQLRKDFEDKAFMRYFLSTIRRTGKGGCSEFVSFGCKTKAEFCAKDKDGNYVEETVDSAWWGWKAAYKFYTKDVQNGSD